MATARRQFNVCQGGTVNTWDGGTVATMIMAACTDIHWKPANEVKTTDTLRGSLVQSDGADVLGLMGQVYLAKLLTYEDANVVLESAYGHATPTITGTATGGTAYKRVYGPAGTVENVPVLRRLEVKNNVMAGFVPTAVPADFQIDGAVRGFTTITENWWGSQYVPGTATAGLSKRTVERVKAGNYAFYIDNQVGGTIGSTLVTDCITKFSYKSGPLWTQKNCLANSLIVTGFSQQPQAPMLDLTIQLGTLSESLKAQYQAGSAVYVRMEALGGTIGASGGTVQKTWRADLCGQIMAWADEGQTEEQNGEVVAVSFTGIEDTAGTWGGQAVAYTTITAVATLP